LELLEAKLIITPEKDQDLQRTDGLRQQFTLLPEQFLELQEQLGLISDQDPIPGKRNTLTLPLDPTLPMPPQVSLQVR